MDIEGDVSQWRGGVEDQVDTLELGPASQLYKAAVSTLSASLRLIAKSHIGNDREFYKILRDEFEKFYLWNEGFATGSGDLDKILSTSRNLKATVLAAMVSWARSVLRIPKILEMYDLPSLLSNYEKLGVLVQQIDQISKVTQLDLKSRFCVIQDMVTDFGSDSDLDSESSSDAIDELFQDLGTYMEILADLTPALMAPASDVLIEEEIASSTEVLSGVSEPARPFVLAIRDRFPSLDTTIVRRLGEANWHRRQRLCDKLSASTVQEVERPRYEIVSARSESRLESSFGRQSNYVSVTTRTDFSEASIFDRVSTFPTSSRYSIAESVTSFASSAASGSDLGRRRVPVLPDDHDFELPFQCQICGEMLSQIRHRADWKKHVYNDLEPYICLLPECDIGHRTFKSRTEWSNHEFQRHRVSVQWHCNLCSQVFPTQNEFRAHLKQSIGASQAEEIISASKRLVTRSATCEICPFCVTAPAQTQKGFASHVGKHQQEIALAALPNLDNGSDDSSTDSSGNDDDDNDDYESAEVELGQNVESASIHLDKETSIEAVLTPENVSTLGMDDRLHIDEVEEITLPKEVPAGPLGFNVLCDVPEPRIDLVFVHGLGGGSRKTWSMSSDPQHCWPKEWLSRDPEFAHVRISSFGYELDLGSSTKSTFGGLASELLSELLPIEVFRLPTSIILVGHSLGGLIVKQACVIANQEPTYHGIASRIRSFFFLATPSHKRPNTGIDMVGMMSRIIAASGSQRVSVADLDLDPLGIVDINTDFWYHAQNRSCFSFFETYQTGFKALAYGEGLVIDKWSSTMGLAGETTAAMNTDHQGMTRFEDQNDPNYRLLRNALAYTIRQINTEVEKPVQTEVELGSDSGPASKRKGKEKRYGKYMADSPAASESSEDEAMDFRGLRALYRRTKSTPDDDEGWASDKAVYGGTAGRSKGVTDEEFSERIVLESKRYKPASKVGRPSRRQRAGGGLHEL